MTVRGVTRRDVGVDPAIRPLHEGPCEPDGNGERCAEDQSGQEVVSDAGREEFAFRSFGTLRSQAFQNAGSLTANHTALQKNAPSRSGVVKRGLDDFQACRLSGPCGPGRGRPATRRRVPLRRRRSLATVTDLARFRG